MSDDQKPVETPAAPEGTISERDPMELACMLMANFAPRYKQIVSTLDKKAARNLALALCTYPMENETAVTLAMMDSQFKEAFALGDALVRAKSLMVQLKAVEAMDQREKLIQEQESKKEEETVNG